MCVVTPYSDSLLSVVAHRHTTAWNDHPQSLLNTLLLSIAFPTDRKMHGMLAHSHDACRSYCDGAYGTSSGFTFRLYFSGEVCRAGRETSNGLVHAVLTHEHCMCWQNSGFRDSLSITFVSNKSKYAVHKMFSTITGPNCL